jgi:hypothetical protein
MKKHALAGNRYGDERSKLNLLLPDVNIRQFERTVPHGVDTGLNL